MHRNDSEVNSESDTLTTCQKNITTDGACHHVYALQLTINNDFSMERYKAINDSLFSLLPLFHDDQK